MLQFSCMIDVYNRIVKKKSVYKFKITVQFYSFCSTNSSATLREESLKYGIPMCDWLLTTMK